MKYLDDVIDVGPKERVALIGPTTSGKTTLAKQLLKQYPYVVIIDPKGTFKIANSRIASSPEELRRMPVKPYEPQIYRPTDKYWDVDSYDEVFRIIYQRTNTTVYVDEVYGVTNGPQVPKWYRGCITRGAELNIRVFSGSQRPARIPLEILSEAEHIIYFPVRNPDDKKRVAEHTLPDLLEPLTVDHSFYYYRVGDQAAKIYKLKLEEKPK